MHFSDKAWAESVRKVVKDAVENHPDDLDESIRVARVSVRALAIYEQIIDDLVNGCIQELVYQYRDTCNARQGGKTHSTPKVLVGSSKSVQSCARGMYWYFIGGKRLGSLLGGELADLAAKERAISDGHSVNADLLQALSGMVPADKQVSDCVPEAKLEAMRRRLEKKYAKRREQAATAV